MLQAFSSLLLACKLCGAATLSYLLGSVESHLCVSVPLHLLLLLPDKASHVQCRQVGHCRAANVPLKRKYAEFQVSEDALLPVGTLLNAAHFVPGQYVDVQGELASTNASAVV